jgi:uncharacterized membrane protein
VNTLLVCRFEDTAGARRALGALRRLAEDGVIEVDDAALVEWPRRARKPSTETLGSLTGPGGLWGGSWGVLLGLIVLVPIAGPVFGAAAGAFAGTLADIGVDEGFVSGVRELVTPGTSALFVLCGAADADRLDGAVRSDRGATIRCRISREHEERLLTALGEERPGRA